MSDQRIDRIDRMGREAVVKLLEQFGRVVRFTCFFDSENFMMTKYHLVDRSIHAVIENEYGDTIQSTEILCGYRGHGPHQTVMLLGVLGIPEADAEAFVFRNDGIQITFEGDGYSVHHDCWFYVLPGRGTPGMVEILEGCIISSPARRMIAFCDPEQYALPELFQCLRWMDPFSFDYTLDKKTPLLRHAELVDAGFIEMTFLPPDKRFDINLIIRGENFSLYCSISHRHFIATLNSIYLYLTKKDLFFEEHLDSHAILSREQKNLPTLLWILKLLVKRKSFAKSESLAINKNTMGGKGRWR